MGIIHLIFLINLMIKKVLYTILLILIFCINPVYAQSEQTESYKGKILEVNTIDCEEMSSEYLCYTYSVYIKNIDSNVETMTSVLEKTDQPFKVGDSIYLTSIEDLDGEIVWSIT